MRGHTPHPVFAAALAAAALCALAPAWGQATPSGSASSTLQTAAVHTDAAGNLHVTTSANQSVLINGVNFIGELAALKAVVAALEQQQGSTTATTTASTTPSTTPAPLKAFSSGSYRLAVASDGAQSDNLGYSVAVSGSTLVAGAYRRNDGYGASSGAAYVFVRSTGGTWVQQGKLSARDLSANDYFGWSVGISGDSTVVGAPGQFGGAAYVFQRSGSTWTQQAKLIPTDRGADNNFGFSVAIEGDTLVAGSPENDAGVRDSGAAYVFVRQPGQTTWGQLKKLIVADLAAGDQAGHSVAISGDSIVMGAPFVDGTSTSSGAAYVYVGAGSTWTQQVKLLPTAVTRSGVMFGASVGISGDTVAVGAPSSSSVASTAYVFSRSTTGWTQAARLGGLGAAVAISGGTLAIGSSTDSSLSRQAGAVRVYQWTGAAWTPQTQLIAQDGRPGDLFGFSVAIDGDTLVAGAISDDPAATDSGSCYIF